MSPRLRRLSGRQVVSILNRFDFRLLSQKGGYAELRRIGASGTKETITIPIHDELDAGTLRAIFRLVCRYIPEGDLRPHFYSD